MKQEVYSRDEMMHIGMSDMQFLKRSWLEGAQECLQRKCECEEVGERLDYAGRRFEWL